MGGFVQNDLSGALFRNDRKQRDNQPDHTGTCTIDGKEYYMSAWIKTSGSGNKFFSIAFTEKDQAKAKAAAAPAGTYEDFDDDIPF